MADAKQVAAGLRQYPNTPLREPVRPYSNTIAEMVKATFVCAILEQENRDA